MGVVGSHFGRRPTKELVGHVANGIGRPLVTALVLLAIIGAAGPAHNDAGSIPSRVPHTSVDRGASESASESTSEAAASWAGFGGVAITETLSQRLELPSAGGVIVTFVHPEGPAARAGLQAKDVILRADGQPITDGTEWSEWVAQQVPGTEIGLGLRRQGVALDLSLTIEELPANIEVGASTN